MTKEIEHKILVCKEEYERLLSELSKQFLCYNYNQTNYYYDTENLSLYNGHETLRIREKKECLCLEYKYNKKFIGSTRVCEENSHPVKGIPKKLEKEDTRKFGLPDANYILLGKLETNRSDFILSEGVLSLDKNEYLGYVDYEVEVEIENLSLRLASQVLVSDKMNGEVSANGKYSRFISKYLENYKNDK